jgi:RNA recognition motif-containing protein
MVRTKVFVGNLNFQTRENELVQKFNEVGKVISANIITRGPRSLGYGFVEMDSEEDAQKAVQQLNKQEIDGRPVNVEVAKVRDDTQQNRTNFPRESTRGRGRRFRRNTNKDEKNDETPRTEVRKPRRFEPREEYREPREPREPRRFEHREPREPRRFEHREPRRFEHREPRRFEPRREPREVPREGPRERRPRKRDTPLKPWDVDNRTPSNTTLFVANLPFSLDDEKFGQVFKDSGVTFKSAYVVRNQRNGRSKGFGFAEFDNQTEQIKALETINKKIVNERELVVKIALTERKVEITKQ